MIAVVPSEEKYLGFKPKDVCPHCNTAFEYEFNAEAVSRIERQSPSLAAKVAWQRKEHPKACEAELFRRLMADKEAQEKNRALHERLEQEERRIFRCNDFTFSSRFPRDMADKTLESFDCIPENETALSLIRKWEISDTFGFFLSGPPGCGKSHLMIAIVNHILRNDPEAFLDRYIYFGSGPGLMQKLRDTLEDKSELNKARGYHYLFIDDFGSEVLSEWGVEQIFQILEWRVNMNLPTFISSNLSFEEIKTKCHERISSRIKALCVPLQLKGQDRRNESIKTRIKILKEREG